MITQYIKGEQHYDYKKDHIKRSRSAYGSSICRLLRKYHQRFLQQQLRDFQVQLRQALLPLIPPLLLTVP